METTGTENRTSNRKRKRITRGKSKHWAVWLTFGIVFGIMLCEAYAAISAILLPAIKL